ncbi:hypothetical protein [Microbacterium sp. SGAir0570]|uniref:hypothetical protein n=1 Tax=Microbacterium sp. SGAir0570 TaxID=2070348 RepID=UPI0010F64D15|nr:hypothetical protein [Microbacterium sp. SGAir0570]
MAATATVAAVVVALVTSKNATGLAREANAIAWAAIQAQRESVASEFGWRRAAARREAGSRLIVWLPRYIALDDERQRRASFGGQDRRLSEDEVQVLHPGGMATQLEAAGYAHMTELLAHLSVWVSNTPISSPDPEELWAGDDRLTKMTWQLRTAVDRWERDPDPEATLYRAFRVLDAEADAKWPTAGAWDWAATHFQNAESRSRWLICGYWSTRKRLGVRHPSGKVAGVIVPLLSSGPSVTRRPLPPRQVWTGSV